MSIVKLGLINRHVDLSHILSVGEAYFDDRMGSGGWFCGFSIQFALMDEPTHYQWKAEECGGVKYSQSVGHMVEYGDGFWSTRADDTEHGGLVCLANLNKRIEEEILKPWKAYKDAA